MPHSIFDLGISLDHLVVNSIVDEDGKKIDLSENEQETRRTVKP